jgi:hypothetical protein
MPPNHQSRFRVFVLFVRSAAKEEDGFVGTNRRGVDDLRVNTVDQEMEAREESGVVVEEALRSQLGDVAAAPRNAERPPGDREDPAARVRWNSPDIRPHARSPRLSLSIEAHATSPSPCATTTSGSSVRRSMVVTAS